MKEFKDVQVFSSVYQQDGARVSAVKESFERVIREKAFAREAVLFCVFGTSYHGYCRLSGLEGADIMANPFFHNPPKGPSSCNAHNIVLILFFCCSESLEISQAISCWAEEEYSKFPSGSTRTGNPATSSSRGLEDVMAELLVVRNLKMNGSVVRYCRFCPQTRRLVGVETFGIGDAFLRSPVVCIKLPGVL